MRIWDLDPGFLNNQSLLGEHRELHGMISILQNDKKGYRNHPETKRWEKSLLALIIRHELLVEEMKTRKFNHKSPVEMETGKIKWPDLFIDEPGEQFEILRDKYTNKAPGRIKLAKNTYDLWANHKYSVMARDYSKYKNIGQRVAEKAITFKALAELVTSILRDNITISGLKNTLDHMWGYVSQFSQYRIEQLSLNERLLEIRSLSLAHQVTYLGQSTAIGELGYWSRTLNDNNQPKN